MHRLILFSALGALAMASGAPAAAQSYGNPALTTGNAAFIGAQARLSLGGVKPKIPTARLTAGMTNFSFDQSGARTLRTIGNTLEIGLSRAGRPDFFVGGQRYSDVRTKLGIAPLGIALLAAGGLAAVGVVAVAASESKKQPEVVCLGIGVCPPPPPPGG